LKGETAVRQNSRTDSSFIRGANPVGDAHPDSLTVCAFANRCQQFIGDAEFLSVSQTVVALRELVAEVPQLDHPVCNRLVTSIFLDIVRHLRRSITNGTRTDTGQRDLRVLTNRQYLTELTSELLPGVFAPELFWKTDEPRAASRLPPRVAMAVDVMHASAGLRMHLQDVARKVGMSAAHLDRMLKRHTGAAFLGHRRRIRMDRAKYLLEQTLLSVKEVAARCGYESVHTFDRDFRRAHNRSPSEWRRAARLDHGVTVTSCRTNTEQITPRLSDKHRQPTREGPSLPKDDRKH
jgi:AraC-like DNA-binding protein